MEERWRLTQFAVVKDNPARVRMYPTYSHMMVGSTPSGTPSGPNFALKKQKNVANGLCMHLPRLRAACAFAASAAAPTAWHTSANASFAPTFSAFAATAALPSAAQFVNARPRFLPDTCRHE